MIRSFADKMKDKQEAYEAEQKVLAEQAEQARIQKEQEAFDQEQELIEEQDRLFLLKEEQRTGQEYVEWRQEQQLLREQQEQLPAEPIDTGVGMGHDSTWKLTWQTFSKHSNIIDLPMSEKIRLYKLAERQQVDRLNYYANLFSDNQHPNALGSGLYWEDGVITDADEVTILL